MTDMYVIYKSSRIPGKVSYTGPTWDSAGIRHLYQEQYEDLKLAQKIAKELTMDNPVGFRVAKVGEDE